MYHLLADAVIVVHFLFILFVVAGGLLTLHRPRAAWLHLPAACWGAFIEFAGWICPLTPLENHLRWLGGEASYTGDFVARYLIPVIYPVELSAFTQYILGGLVIAVNLMIYGYIFRRRFLSRA
ncbi:MAG: DUF2784 domain-containing protein [Smithellaceae bacterium]|jgi:hypothetical protein|nr:DUF2784 domain-containing protein [Smithellaceae bacterium]